MDAILLKNTNGNIGLAVIEETRKLKCVVYDGMNHSLTIEFNNGETDTIDGELDKDFMRSLYSIKEIYIAHYTKGNLQGEPVDDYKVPLTY